MVELDTELSLLTSKQDLSSPMRKGDGPKVARNNEIDSAGRFAILVMCDTHGALVREAAPPKRQKLSDELREKAKRQCFIKK
jgi:hypothetical protein